ncbi:hypothetical protein AZI87_06345 [Bdellovibrio bacteriovorus]|uniref:DUF3108 domain-containing protein n=1 Tax=Bdellovibrio bacteriovorus TaxID=959 RepID=A0A162GSB1_BDEBC|nr:hypothetical protein [Bdellovibrio bacteriovorus]KYG68845.1 hypothetical protein AZI87_06345 [Bdellovibrio bacteriovorus]
MVRSILLAVAVSMLSLSARAEILFEGYSKILSNDQHIGYVISRYEFDAKKKHFISTYFLKTGKGPTEVTESLKAVADSELAPVSYEYTNLAGKESKTIDAKFKNGTMSGVILSGGKTQRIEKKIPKGTFLSTFLVYLMLKSKEGLRSETNYEYQAIAEEDGAITKGQALVGKEETFNGFKVFKILNTFKDMKFLSYVNDRGEVLGTNAMGQGITTELVASPSEATANLPYSATLLKTLFGNVPIGQANVVYRSLKLKEAEANAPAPSKQMGVPQGQGIIIKAQPEKAENKGN